MSFSFMEQMEENVRYSLIYPYHIDFEKLLLIEFQFKDNKEIMSKIEELKEDIVLNYITRKQLISRLCTKYN